MFLHFHSSVTVSHISDEDVVHLVTDIISNGLYHPHMFSNDL